jgi:hypothetical protein
MTRDATMDRAMASNIYCKWTNNSAFSWTLYYIATYLKKKNIKFLILLVKSDFNLDTNPDFS